MTPLETIQKLYASFGERDFRAFRELCSPTVQWLQNPGFPGGAIYDGADAIIKGVFERNDALWKDFRFELESMHEAGDVVIVTGHYTGKNSATNVPFRASVAHIYDVADGAVQRFRMFADTHTLHQS
ncbi:MAG: ketosteroid isomerase-like protein, partial [Verrucomicrobiales bacterium]